MRIQTIQDIRKFVEEHPEHPISAAWEDLIYEMDDCGEVYTFQDFVEEAEEQACEGNLSPYDLEQLFGG